MARWTVPGIKITEVDESIRTSAAPTLGIGAIVMKSNKGPVNQRIVTSSYDEFTKVFGEPENLDDYGHFAAENFLSNGSQLYAVRATMGDEAYAQIQYPYTDAEYNDKYESDDTAVFKFIDNEDNSNIELLQKLDTVVELDTIIKNDEWLVNSGDLKNTFYAYQQGQFVTINDVISDAPEAVAVFKSVGAEGQDDSLENVTNASGKYVAFASNVSNDGDVISVSDDLVLTNDAWSTSALPVAFFEYQGMVTYSGVSGFKYQFTVPKTDTLNNKPYSCTCYLTKDAKDSIEAGTMTYSALFNNSSFYKGQYAASGEGYCTAEDALKLSFTDWDDLTTKTYYVTSDSVEDRVGQAAAISFREYGMTNTDEALVIASKTGIGQKYALRVETIPDIIDGSEKISYQMLTNIVNDYGVELSEVSSDAYSILSYVEVQDGMEPDEPVDEIDNLDTGKRKYKLIFTDSFNPSTYQNDSRMYNENLFWMYSTKGSAKNILKSTYTVEDPALAVIPWQEGMIKQGSLDPTPIDRMGAFSTSEVLNSTDETYRDGYTISIESDDEPGNGDIERYVSNKANQLIIAALGPGKYGNDVGVSVITTACADIKALNHQNAFMWKYKYDDEDLVNKDTSAYDENPLNLTWKKVYRINVYIKSKSQTADGAWGSGLDALVRDPVESWFVSNDPTAKDEDGNSLFAPNVINGKSEYIYVSRASVNDSMTGAGTYAMPIQTFSVYSLTGGENSKKNNIAEKTQALKLYSDRQKADFDILFNVDAIDTFNGRQRFAAHQQKIAEIAANRTMDIGMVQVTSKESKTIKRMLSEGKNFAFKNGSYVAPYANYDKYYNSTLASWVYLPKSVAGACAEAFCQVTGEPWMAPAGVAKGSIEYATNQLKRLTDDEIGQLYINNINTSRLCGAYGEVLWGQKTALKKDSALNRINVRCCLNYVEKQLEQMMNPFLFQQNTPNTRSSAKNVIDSFLDRVKAAGGVIDYSSSVEEDPDDPHIMLVKIKIRPAETIEWISITITVTRSAINVTED